MTLKENILKLRSEGKTYKQIVEALGCSNGTVSFHCGEGVKDKAQERGKINKRNARAKKGIVTKHFPNRTFTQLKPKFGFNKREKKVKTKANDVGKVSYDLKPGLTVWDLPGKDINLLKKKYGIN